MSPDPGLLFYRPDQTTSRPSSSNQRLLLVEDDAPVRRGFARALRHCGFQVSTACSVAEGLRADAIHDWLLLDIDLGDGNGVELAEQLIDRRQVRRVVFVTGCVDWRQLCRAAELGSVLHKPIRLRELLRALGLDPVSVGVVL